MYTYSKVLKRKIISIIAIIVVFGITFASIRCSRCWMPPPNVLYFLIEKDGVRLPDSILLNTKLYYFNESGQKIDRFSPTSDDTSFIFFASRSSPNNLSNTGVMESGYVSGLPNTNKTWYLQYPNGDIDTFFVEATKVSCKEGQKNRCHCENPYTKVQFNGKDAPEVTDLHTDDGKPIYLFEK